MKHIELIDNIYVIKNSKTIIPKVLVDDMAKIHGLEAKVEIKLIIQDELTFQKFDQNVIDEIKLEFDSL